MGLPRLERLAALGAGAALAAATGGCSFDGSGQAAPGGDGGTSGIQPDADDGVAGRDASPLDAPEQCTGWDVLAVVDSCEIPSAFRRDALVIPAGVYTYNTDDGVLLRQGGGEVEHDSILIEDFRIVSAASIAIEDGAEVRAVGGRPLALVSWGDMTVDGSIDVSSHLAGAGRGAGSDPLTPCTAGGVNAGAGLEDEDGGGGGGGGAFGTSGGLGGDGASKTAGASGDRSPGPTRLRGGCPGGAGGIGVSGVTSAGGGGGGAIALVALGALSVTGQIDAGGAGGGGGSLTRGGGGGGGSGGLIWLDGASITLTSSTILAANGGAGGEGSDDDAAGDVGDDAPAGGARAFGGDTGGNSGGDGGDGSTAGADGAPGAPGTSNSGGGGGGGGAGVIDLDSDEVEEGGAFITPPPR